MDFFAEVADEQRVSSALKRSIPIGIFGSFWHRNQPILEIIRARLRAAGYNARLSFDLAQEHPQEENEDDDSYNLRISQLLLDQSCIHIFVFFAEADSEHYINLSASMEFERLCEQAGPHDALILIEEGMLALAGGYFRGRWAKTCRDLHWETYIRNEDNLVADAIEFETLIRQFCLQRIIDLIRRPRTENGER